MQRPARKGFQLFCWKNAVLHSPHPVARIWRSSLETGEIPTICKSAVITQIHKGKSRAVPKNYHPVALTSHLIKDHECQRTETTDRRPHWIVRSSWALHRSLWILHPSQSSLYQLLLWPVWSPATTESVTPATTKIAPQVADEEEPYEVVLEPNPFTGSHPEQLKMAECGTLVIESYGDPRSYHLCGKFGNLWGHLFEEERQKDWVHDGLSCNFMLKGYVNFVRHVSTVEHMERVVASGMGVREDWGIFRHRFEIDWDGQIKMDLTCVILVVVDGCRHGLFLDPRFI